MIQYPLPPLLQGTHNRQFPGPVPVASTSTPFLAAARWSRSAFPICPPKGWAPLAPFQSAATTASKPLLTYSPDAVKVPFADLRIPFETATIREFCTGSLPAAIRKLKKTNTPERPGPLRRPWLACFAQNVGRHFSTSRALLQWRR